MLSSLSIRNFKSLKAADIPFGGSMTAIVGRNNSGKSAVLDAILFSVETSQIGRVTPPPMISGRGGWSELTFGKQESAEPIVVGLTLVTDRPEILGVSVGMRTDPLGELSVRYTVEATENEMARRIGLRFANGDSAEFEYDGPTGKITQGDVTFEGAAFARVLGRTRFLRAERQAAPKGEVAGSPILATDGSNLIKVLNDLASSRNRVLDQIVRSVSEVIPEIDEVLAKLIAQQNVAVGAIRERAFGHVDFQWPHLASGTKQVILISTFVHTAPPGALLLVEEPELYLHLHSIWRLLDLLDEECLVNGKQVVVTTHSPAIVERLGLSRCIVVSRPIESGESTAESLSAFTSLDPFLQKHGLMTQALLMPSEGLRPLPAFLLVVEGQEDVPLWEQFLSRAGVAKGKVMIHFVRNGGWAEAGKAAGLFKVLRRLGVAEVPLLLVVEADENEAQKIANLVTYGLDESDYVIVPVDMEAYLMNSAAIAQAVNRPKEEVTTALRSVRGRDSKERLERVMRSLGASLNSGVRRRIAAALPRLPSEIGDIVSRIKERSGH